MIIIGYQGIGKSSVSGAYNNCIDLESSNFWHECRRPDDWYIYYCKIAVDLSKQGFTVFTSSHEVVRNYLLKFTDVTPIVCVFPSASLKDVWIERLRERYEKDTSMKNRKALENAMYRYEESINDMTLCGHLYYEIDDTDFENGYDLMKVVKHLRAL